MGVAIIIAIIIAILLIIYRLKYNFEDNNTVVNNQKVSETNIINSEINPADSGFTNNINQMNSGVNNQYVEPIKNYSLQERKYIKIKKLKYKAGKKGAGIIASSLIFLIVVIIYQNTGPREEGSKCSDEVGVTICSKSSYSIEDEKTYTCNKNGKVAIVTCSGDHCTGYCQN